MSSLPAQVPVLTKQGYRVIAPDLRGFGDSDKPQDPELYGMQHLVKDVNSILDELEIAKVHCVIGHDWGSAVAWQLAGRFPQRYQRLVALSVGHNACMFSLGGTRQREKSWYMLFFKVPLLWTACSSSPPQADIRHPLSAKSANTVRMAFAVCWRL